MFKNYLFFIGMAIICLMVATFFSYADEKLVFDSHLNHQVWRLITAHFVHTDIYHLISNLLAFAILLYLFPLSWQKQVQVFIVAILLIDLYLLIFPIEIYAGLSGLIYAIPGVKFFQLIKQRQYKSALLILSILLVYVFILSPQSHSISWQPLKGAHLLGLVAGFFGLSHFNVQLKKMIALFL